MKLILILIMSLSLYASSIESLIEQREGNVKSVYIDTRGNLTSGIGHKLSYQESKIYQYRTYVPKHVRKEWFRRDLKKARRFAIKQAEAIGIKDEEFIDALVSVNFQLGGGWKNDHKRTWKALLDKDYKLAYIEIDNSNWNNQTPKRVNDFKKAIQKLIDNNKVHYHLKIELDWIFKKL